MTFRTLALATLALAATLGAPGAPVSAQPGQPAAAAAPPAAEAAAQAAAKAAAHAADKAEHAARMAQEHQHDSAAASPATMPAPTQTVAAEEIVYATLDGKPVKGYLTRPVLSAPATQPLPALVVIQEWWGLNDNVRTMARRFAGEGYLVLAVDLYEGTVATTPEAAMAAMQSAMAKPARLTDNLRQAQGYLASQWGATKIGVVGWCFGGGWALETALGIPEGIDAAVMYYGRTQSDPKALGALKAPLLGLFGGKDQGIPIDGVRAMEHELAKLGKNATIVVYPEADHAFANPTGNNYQAGPAEDAWGKTIAFFAQHLKN